ncbi:putative integral membrane protein (apicoplast) [Theileria parva strain Muguga]|uniref:Uncharacterized protein n=1 Tax=Theileria parva TaxID=5875 RepID=Q4MY84_THEPA|nr:putative integral membrane protein [Theileria parva strain Muguga]|eukprot:XP_762708.1 hypothetical protein (apicoplast) [Theileria parva strain Muguga]
MNNRLNKLMKFVCIIYIYIKYIFSYMKYIYICLFIYNIYFFETAMASMFAVTMGEWYLEEFWARRNFTMLFYSTLWYIITKKIRDKFELLRLEWVWKIKRSNNSIIKKIAKFLSKYDWFNNNIINF